MTGEKWEPDGMEEYPSIERNADGTLTGRVSSDKPNYHELKMPPSLLVHMQFNPTLGLLEPAGFTILDVNRNFVIRFDTIREVHFFMQLHKIQDINMEFNRL